MRCANGATLTSPDVFLRSEGHAIVQVAAAAAKAAECPTQRFGKLSPNILRYSTEKRPSSTKPRPVAISVTVADRPRADISARRGGDRENPIVPSLERGLVLLLLEHHIYRFDDPNLRICFAIDNHFMFQLFRTGYVEVVLLCKAVVPATVPGCQPVSIALPGSRKGGTR